jgi:hypothetical protein
MSSRAHNPWLKKMKRIIGRSLHSESLSVEDVCRLYEAALSSIQMQPLSLMASMVRGTDYSSCQELDRFIRMSYRLGDLTPVDAFDMFDELLQ